jgi:SSS family solute:Na+ symporter
VNVVLAGILGYILLQLFIGILMSRRIADEEDYLLAGRSLGLVLGTFTVFATWFGAETCIGAAGSVYEAGLAGGSADPFGYALCLIVMGLLFAVPLWRRKLTTMADLFRTRYSPRIEQLAVLMMAPASVMWAGAQIRAFGQILSASSDFEVEIAITVAAAVVIAYTVYGGLLADVMTDLVQGIALIVGLAVLLVAILETTGGLEAAVGSIEPAQLRLFGDGRRPIVETVEAWAIPLTGSLFAQELVARILASRSPRLARASCLLAGGLYLLVGLIPVFMGLIGFRLLPGLDHPEQIILQLAQLHLSTVAYVLFAGALISAILSTVDSALLAASALVSHNLLAPLARNLSDTGKVRMARGGVIIFGLIAYLLALCAEGVYALVEDASAFSGAGLFVVVLFGLYSRIGHTISAASALIAGMAVWVLGRYVLALPVPYMTSMVVALIVYLAAAIWESRAMIIGQGQRRLRSVRRQR